MTVKDLIAKLATMPPDAVVVIDMYSESSKLADEQPVLREMIERNGTYMLFHEQFWDYAKDGQPTFLKVCHFPGN